MTSLLVKATATIASKKNEAKHLEEETGTVDASRNTQTSNSPNNPRKSTYSLSLSLTPSLQNG